MRSSAHVQVTAIVDFLQVAAQSNFLISALNTVATIAVHPRPIYSYNSIFFTKYVDKDSGYTDTEMSTCDIVNPVAPAGFYSTSYRESAVFHTMWPLRLIYPQFEPNASAMVDGFFGGCTPFRAILASNLDCLSNITCIEQFGDYFSTLNQVCMRLTFSFEKKSCLSRLN